MPYQDLQSFVVALEKAGELRRITVEVDPRLEITEIYDRVVKTGGPALLFENVKGADFPLLINPLGSPGRIEIALGRSPASFGAMLLDAAERANPPSPAALWQLRSTLWQLTSMRTKRVRSGACQEVVETPDLGRLPVQTCWPGDGGPFITFGLVITHDPRTGERNTGVYRLQLHGSAVTGMHWQIQKGGGFHYAAAEKVDRELEVAVVIGADPALLIAAVTALPEGMDEIAFSGLLRGAPCRMVRCKSVDLDVPAGAEFVLEGVVPPQERQLEGPFGDHFGHYSHAAPFPVFHVRRLTRRRRPLYLSAVVGKPPQEDKHIGNATQEIIGPLIRVIHPEIEDVWAYFETGFHNLLVVAVHERFYKEAVKTALALMGTGQLALSKCAVLVDAGVPVRDFDAVMDCIREHFEPQKDFLMLPGVALDTLDFTSFQMNLGSKMILDATAGSRPTLHGSPGADRLAVLDAFAGAALPEDLARALATDSEAMDTDTDALGFASTPSAIRTAVPDPRALEPRVEAYTVIREALLVVRVRGEGRQAVENLVLADLGTVRIVAAVSSDVPLDDRDLLLWGIFTRFDCARDVIFTRSEHRGPWTTSYGVMGIDATFKPGYPETLEMDSEINRLVDRKWPEYGLD